MKKHLTVLGVTFVGAAISYPTLSCDLPSVDGMTVGTVCDMPRLPVDGHEDNQRPPPVRVVTVSSTTSSASGVLFDGWPPTVIIRRS